MVYLLNYMAKSTSSMMMKQHSILAEKYMLGMTLHILKKLEFMIELLTNIYGLTKELIIYILIIKPMMLMLFKLPKLIEDVFKKLLNRKLMNIQVILLLKFYLLGLMRLKLIYLISKFKSHLILNQLLHMKLICNILSEKILLKSIYLS